MATSLCHVRTADKAHGSGRGGAMSGGRLRRSGRACSGMPCSGGSWHGTEATTNGQARHGMSSQWWQHVGTRERPAWPQKSRSGSGRRGGSQWAWLGWPLSGRSDRDSHDRDQWRPRPCGRALGGLGENASRSLTDGSGTAQHGTERFRR
jgi:hypothetical protein